MQLDRIKQSLAEDQPPAELSGLVQAMWWDAKGDWDRAHDIAQDENNSNGSWVHAYLHRKEGDNGNAAYWYRLAGRPVCSTTLDEEWDSIVSELMTSE